MDEERARFEKWATSGSRKGPSMARSRFADDPNYYDDHLVAAWWQAWQAALHPSEAAPSEPSAAFEKWWADGRFSEDHTDRDRHRSAIGFLAGWAKALAAPVLNAGTKIQGDEAKRGSETAAYVIELLVEAGHLSPKRLEQAMEIARCAGISGTQPSDAKTLER